MTSPARLSLQHNSTQWKSLLNDAMVATSTGALSGSFAAYAYYDDVLRPLSHTFAIWITMVALLSANQPRLHAVLRSTVALFAAVVAFYVGKMLVYGLRYPAMPYELNNTTVATWLTLALIVGLVLGVTFSRIGSHDRGGAIGVAGAIGLLFADSLRRVSNYAADAGIVISFTVIAISAILAVSIRTRQQLVEAAAWTPPMAVVGYLLVSGPDLLEQLLYTGGL